jgi:RNA recognition motif-containing protein
MATKTLYVGNLPYSVTETALASHFSAYGGNNARIIEGRGFGFVDIDGEKLEAAVADKHNTQFEGRTLTVNEATPRGERGGSGGGGGNRSGGGGGGGGYSSGGGGGRSSGGGGGGRGSRW